MYSGDSILVAFDQGGFRVDTSTNTALQPSDRVDILYLGCSLTFGYGCPVEDTYPQIVSKSTELKHINAAVSAYGLSQMYLLTKRLIPLYRPKFVVFQRSSWLTDRALNPFNRVDQGLLTVPYFSQSGLKPEVKYPVVKSHVFEVIRAKASGKFNSGFLHFHVNFGMAHIVREHYLYLSTMFRMLWNADYRPATNAAHMELAIYQEMIEIALDNGATPIILYVGYRNNDAARIAIQPHGQLTPITVNADSLLIAKLGFTSDQDTSPDAFDLCYDRAYSHWQIMGNDSILIDNHPNEFAHRIIAEALLTKVGFWSAKW